MPIRNRQLTAGARLLSALAIGSVGIACKAFLNLGFCGSVRVRGLEILRNALEDEAEAASGRGLITVSNHISTMDDPLTWGILPLSYYFSILGNPKRNKMRWTLGASDIVFTNPIFSEFFRHGQVLETFRGKGVYQEAIDTSIEKLDQGQWIHMYPEGYVNQKSNTWPLRRFKWGIARMLMETKVTPTVIPMYITGFDRIMPERRPVPAKFIPLAGQDLTITFGGPDLITRHVESELARWRLEQTRFATLSDVLVQSRTAEARSRLTAIVQDDLEQLGRSLDPGRRERYSE